MSFVSIKRYLGGDESERSYKRIISLLINGIAESAVRTEDDEYGRFRAALGRIGTAAEDAATEEQLFVAAGSALQALDSYNQRTARLVRQQEAEMQHIASMLAQTVLAITEGSDRSGDVLTAIKRDLQNAAAVEDIQKVRFRLAECLQRVREEAHRQKRDAEATVASLRDQIARTEVAQCTNGIDPATGLQGRDAAELLLSELVINPGRKYVLTVVMERFDLIQSRFNASVAEAALRTLRRHLDGQLAGCMNMFRWAGPALVAILRRAEAIDVVRNDVKRIMETRLEKDFHIGARTALVPISATWSVIAVAPPVVDMCRQIDTFISSQTPREYA